MIAFYDALRRFVSGKPGAEDFVDLKYESARLPMGAEGEFEA